jgi:polar amino acid transport system permease protein
MEKNLSKTSGAKGELPVLLPFNVGRGEQESFSASMAKANPWQVVLFLVACFVVIGISEAFAAGNAARPGPFVTLIRWVPFIMKGFVMNLVISFSAMAIGTLAGVALGLMQISLIPPVRHSSWVVTQFFRNSPWLVLLFCIMLLLPYRIEIGEMSISIPDWIKATLGFSLPVMANISEVVRGAVQSLPTGQWESAESLAFTRRQTLWLIILPQCIKRMIPPWMNWYAILTMATPLCSIMGVEEAVRFSQQALEAEGSRPELLMPFYSFLLVIFFVYCYPIARWTIRLEKRFLVME